MVDDVRKLAERLGSRGYDGLDLELAVIPGEYHSTVAAGALTRGLRYFFSSEPSSP